MEKGGPGPGEQVECYTGCRRRQLQAGVWSPGAQRVEGGAVGRRHVHEQEVEEEQEEERRRSRRRTERFGRAGINSENVMGGQMK